MRTEMSAARFPGPQAPRESILPVDDWLRVRDVDLSVDPVTREAVFSFTRNSIRRARHRVGA